MFSLNDAGGVAKFADEPSDPGLLISVDVPEYCDLTDGVIVRLELREGTLMILLVGRNVAVSLSTLASPSRRS